MLKACGDSTAPSRTPRTSINGLLTSLEPESLLARRGLRPGDVITGCNRTSIEDLGEFEEVVGSVRGSLFLEVRRDGNDYVVRMD